MADGFKRVIALGAATVALAAGAALGTVGSASAATPHHAPVDSRHCHEGRGYWTRVWHPAYRDRHGRWHHGYWTTVWHRARWGCGR